MPKPIIAFSCFAALAIAASASAATFVVPSDRELVRRAHAIVIANALPSYTRLTDDGGIETVTPMEVEERIKGRVGDVVNVVEPGGTFGDMTTFIAGVPTFAPGDHLLLFLAHAGKDRWAVTDLVLGKYTFTTGADGQQLLLRDEAEIVGWNPDLTQYAERARSRDRFLQFVRTEANGGVGVIDYFLSAPAANPPAS